MKTSPRILHQQIKRCLASVFPAGEIGSISHLILEDVFDLDKKDIILNQYLQVTKSKQQELSDVLEKLQAHEPIQYILGHTEFYSRKFYVNPSVLVPRPETEELVQMVIKENQATDPKILDIGTGSGCVAITLQLELDTQVFACDIATEALTTAKHNASSLGATVKFFQCDILQQQPEVPPLHILVSNPPYVTESEKKQMKQNVLDHEPASALFVSDQDPLIFHKRIASIGRELLKPGGKIYFEINERFGDQTKILLQDYGYQHIEVTKDLQGKDRFAKAIWQATN